MDLPVAAIVISAVMLVGPLLLGVHSDLIFGTGAAGYPEDPAHRRALRAPS